ncbi:MAG: ROK family protein [Caldilineaceae bacterium]|nr:ROK family protein [Caldilineaceae bacterium]
MSELIVGVDLGGTQVRAVVAHADGEIVARHATRTNAQEGPQAVLARIAREIGHVLQGRSVAAIGVGAPGPTDPSTGLVLVAHNLPGWRNVNLCDELGEHFDAPVFVGNDANLAALAEHRYGAGRGCGHMIYLTVSTGIGAGVIVENRMLLGVRGLAAELGHTTIDAQAEQHGDNVVGTLEGLTSGPNIARRAQEALALGAKSLALEAAGGQISAVSPELLNRAAHAGDTFAREQFRESGRYLGIGITNMLHTFNPERIVIGGSVWLHARNLMIDSVWETIRARAESPEYWQELQILDAALGEDVGLLGAVAVAADGLQQRNHK